MCLKKCKTLSCGRLQISGWGFERQRRNHDSRFSKTGIFTQTSLNKMCANDWCSLNACVVRVEQHDLTEYSGKTNSNFFTHHAHYNLKYSAFVDLYLIQTAEWQVGFCLFFTPCFNVWGVLLHSCCFLGTNDNQISQWMKKEQNSKDIVRIVLFFFYIGKPCQNL